MSCWSWIVLMNLELELEYWESGKRWIMRSLSIGSGQWTVLDASDKPLVVFTTTHDKASFRPAEMKSMRFAIKYRILCSPVGSVYNGIWAMLFQAWLLWTNDRPANLYMHYALCFCPIGSLSLSLLGTATFIRRIELHYTDSKTACHFSRLVYSK